MSANEFVTVVDQIAITILTDAQRLLRFLSLGDIMDQDKLRRPASERQTARRNIDVDNGAVFFTVAPLARVLRRGVLGSKILFQQSHLLGWTNVFDRHLEELRTRVAIVAHGRVVHCEEAKRGQVVNPHRLRIRFEQQTILRFRFSQCFLDARRDSHVEHERKHRDQFACFVVKRGVVPLAVEDSSEFRVVAIA